MMQIYGIEQEQIPSRERSSPRPDHLV